MAGNRQLDDLCALYAEKSEPELLALYAQHEDLTDVAQQALAQVMQDRRIVAPSLAVPEVTGPVGATDAGEEFVSQPLDADEVCIFTFTDAFQASEALRLLKNEQIVCRIVNWDELKPRTDPGGPPMRLGMVVTRTDAAQAKHVLQQAMNLFPPAEGVDAFEELTGMMLVGVFAREDALLVAHALGSDGVSYLWSDDREDPEADTDHVQIQVNAPQLDHAHQLAERALSAAS